MIDKENFFNHLINNCQKSFDNISKISAAQGNDYTTGLLYQK